MKFKNGEIFKGTFENDIPIIGKYTYINKDIYNGKVNKNFPPIANNTANNISTTNNKIRKPLEIFFDETFVKNFIKKYLVAS